MKKLFSVLIITTVICGTFFAKENTIADRYFELRTDVPFDVSNNTLAITDYLQPELVIDLNEFARKMPNDGLVFTMSTNPQEEINLNLKPLSVKAGLVVGADFYGQFGISKGIFNFICNGNEIGEEIDTSIMVRADVFSYATANASFKVGKFGVTVSPTYFIPIMHAYADKAGATISNTDNGDFILDLEGNSKVYSVYNITDKNSKFAAGSSAGFDLGGSVSYPINNHLKVTGSLRLPVVPGHLNYSTSAGFSMYKKFNFKDLIGKNGSDTSADSEEDSEDAKEDTPFSFYYDENWMTDNYSINRPFKMNALVDFEAVPNLITLRGGLGIGVRNPFSPVEKESKFFPEYYAGAKFDIIHMISATISTEYTNTIFKHQIATVLNFRVLELDVGCSTQSSSFAGSLRLAGAGAFVNFAFGF